MNMLGKMGGAANVLQEKTERSRVILALLEAIDREGGQSQRAMAGKFGVALGLVNAYLKFCIKKGYVKVRRLPRRRCVYMLTPKGFSEKLRLTLLLLSKELHRFRHARLDYGDACRAAHRRGWRQVVLIGASELAEISAICALENDIKIAAVVDPLHSSGRFIGVPVVPNLADVGVAFDGALITEVRDSRAAYTGALSVLGVEGVIAPAFFGFAAGQERTT